MAVVVMGESLYYVAESTYTGSVFGSYTAADE